MIDADKTKRQKARQLRYKKPIAKDLNLMTIREELWDIQEECEDVHWYVDTDKETLINALDGNEDEAYEFRMMFGDLCAECERMLEDLDEAWIPDCFDQFFCGNRSWRGFRRTFGIRFLRTGLFRIILR